MQPHTTSNLFSVASGTSSRQVENSHEKFFQNTQEFRRPRNVGRNNELQELTNLIRKSRNSPHQWAMGRRVAGNGRALYHTVDVTQLEEKDV